MLVTESFRHNLSALVLRCVFVVLYLGGALLLLSGLILTAQAWWTLVHRHGALLAISSTTAEIFVLAAAFFSILIIPHLENSGSKQKVSRRRG